MSSGMAQKHIESFLNLSKHLFGTKGFHLTGSGEDRKRTVGLTVNKSMKDRSESYL